MGTRLTNCIEHRRCKRTTVVIDKQARYITFLNTMEQLNTLRNSMTSGTFHSLWQEVKANTMGNK